MLNAYIGRQAIYTREKEVHAYELLYRSGVSGAADFVDGSQATSQVVLNSFLEIGLGRLVGTRPAFINCTRDFLTQGHALSLPPECLVLEVLEDIEPDAEMLATLRSLKDAGYTIALDDFVLRESRNPVLELADLIKVELPALTREQISHHIDALQPRGVILLAEKVETREEFEFCKALGFELFQGYFLSKPHIVQERRAAPRPAGSPHCGYSRACRIRTSKPLSSRH
jgi:EAL and modified HD-GYP domain-containing signal transduction protein